MEPATKRVLLTLGIVVLCLPMLFVTWLMLSAFWPRMDALTLKLPMPLRGIVADVALQQNTKESGLRALKLDPDSVGRRQRSTTYTSIASIEAANRESRLQASKFAKQAMQDEANGDDCAAEDEYANAASKNAGDDGSYTYVEGMGRAGFFCGHLYDAISGFETAIEKQQRYLKQADLEEDDIQATKADMLHDREWLILIYNRNHQPDLAKAACSQAHPDWLSCLCKLKGKDVLCTAGK